MKKTSVLRKNWEFQKIINAKQQYISKHLIFYYVKSDKNLRVGISISKKFANAVYRNKYKRQVRSILDQLNYFHIKYDLIIIVRKDFLKLDYEVKKEKIKKMLERF